MTPNQSKAARGLLGWSQPELVKKSGMSIATVKRFESGLAPVSDEAVEAMKGAMEKAGIDFIAIGENSSNGGEGVRYGRRGKK